jgi:hypothetical protein
MNIGEEEEPINLPIPVDPRTIPVEQPIPAPIHEPVHEPIREPVPVAVPVPAEPAKQDAVHYGAAIHQQIIEAYSDLADSGIIEDRP